jgi:transposase
LQERYAHWEHLSALGAVTLSADRQRSRVFLSFASGSVKSENVVAALRTMRRHLRGEVVLLWDRLTAHRGRLCREYLEKQRSWLQVEWFPAYAPELNPVEGLWSWLDATALANFCPDHTEEVAHQVRQGLRRLRRNPDLPKAFLKHAKLFPEL